MGLLDKLNSKRLDAQRLAAKALEAARTLPERVQQLPQMLDAKLREGEALQPKVTDPAVLAALKAVQGVLGHDFVDVTPYGMYLRFDDFTEEAKKQAGATLSHLPKQFTIGNTIELLKALAQRENEVVTTQKGMFGGSRPKKTTIQGALMDAGANAVFDAQADVFLEDSAHVLARAIMVWGSETPMDLLRDATRAAGAEGVVKIEPVVKAALYDEAMQVLGKGYKANQVEKTVTEPRGMLSVMDAAEKHGAKGAILEGLGNKVRLGFEERLVERAARQGRVHTEESRGKLGSLLSTAEEFSIRSLLSLAERIDVKGADFADALFRDEAKVTRELYDEALREGVVAFVHTVLKDASDTRYAELVRMVQETAVTIEKEEMTIGRHFGNGWRRVGRKPLHTVTEDLARANAKDGDLRQRREQSLAAQIADGKVKMQEAVDALAEMPEDTTGGRRRRRSPELDARALQSQAVETLREELAGLEREQREFVQSGESDSRLVEIFETATKHVRLKDVAKAMSRRAKNAKKKK